MATPEALTELFHGLNNANFQITSPQTDAYNCIAWAAGETLNWWWPDFDEQDTWPAGVPREETVSAFHAAFATLGYVDCAHAEFEQGLEKIAIFAVSGGIPKHAARQLPNGRWTSKLGHLDDIEHELRDLEGDEYGSVVVVMQRPREVQPISSLPSP